MSVWAQIYCVRIYAYIFTQTRILAHINICILYIYVYIYIHTYICVRVCVCVCVCVFVCVWVSV